MGNLTREEFEAIPEVAAQIERLRIAHNAEATPSKGATEVRGVAWFKTLGSGSLIMIFEPDKKECVNESNKV